MLSRSTRILLGHAYSSLDLAFLAFILAGCRFRSAPELVVVLFEVGGVCCLCFWGSGAFGGTVRSKICVRRRNLVIFGRFQNNFRPKNRNFQNCPIKRARRASRQGNFENFDFLAENYSENVQK